MTEHAHATMPKEHEREAAHIVACFGGDALAAVAELLAENAHLRHELRLTQIAVSYGYSRGWHAREAETH